MGINFTRTYFLNDEYDSIKGRAKEKLAKYQEYPELLTFNEDNKSVMFTSERLIPTISTDKPRVMLLFSNPHPHSIHQGMFLSPNTIGRENPFWLVMKEAGWIGIPEGTQDPSQLAEVCLKVAYEGPFELIFYPYYAFPTDFPEHIKSIFGKKYFNDTIEPEDGREFRRTVQATKVEAVVTFNKGIFNLVAKDPIKRYIKRLKEGELVHSQVEGVGRVIPIFLTFPTGWRYHKGYRQLRKDNLVSIRKAICSGLPVVDRG